MTIRARREIRRGRAFAPALISLVAMVLAYQLAMGFYRMAAVEPYRFAQSRSDCADQVRTTFAIPNEVITSADWSSRMEKGAVGSRFQVGVINFHIVYADGERGDRGQCEFVFFYQHDRAPSLVNLSLNGRTWPTS